MSILDLAKTYVMATLVLDLPIICTILKVKNQDFCQAENSNKIYIYHDFSWIK